MAGLVATQLIQYYFYKQATFVSSNIDPTCYPILSIADGGNGQLVITTDDTSALTVGVAVTITSTANYDGNYSVLSLTPTTFNVSGTFVGTDTGCFELSANLTGANVGDPLDFGRIFFFDNADKTTPQNTYADRDLTIPNPNPIVLDSNGSTPPPYLIDNPYYIEIYDKFNNLVATLDNYLPGGGGSIIPEVELPLGNLFPTYGFDARINESIYALNNFLLPNQNNPISTGWYWIFETNTNIPNNSYEYIAVNPGTIVGNPKNKIILKSTNNTTGVTLNRVNAAIGDYNAFQEKQLAISIFAQIISGSSPTLVNIVVFRTRQGLDPVTDWENPVVTVPINVTDVETQFIIPFTVPALTLADYNNDDLLICAFDLPLNTDLQIQLTATWLQLSEDGTVAITETAVSENAAKQVFSYGARFNQSDEQFLHTGLPTAVGEGRSVILNQTGAIFEGATGTSYNYALPMGQNNSIAEAPELIRNELIKFTHTDRLIDYLRANNLTASRNTFLASNASNVVSVELGIGAPENSTWVSNAAPRITLTKTQDELIHKISAHALGNGQVRFIFTDNFNAETSAFNPAYTDGSPLYVGGFIPDSPIINWIGFTRFIEIAPYPSTSTLDARTRQITIQNGDAGSPAIVDIRFPSAHSDSLVFEELVSTDEGPAAQPAVSYYLEQSQNIYKGEIFGVGGISRIIRSTVDGQHEAFTAANFLAYNDIANNPTPQPAQPPHVIRFSIDGQSPTGPTGSISTATVALDTNFTAAQVATAIVRAVNTSFIYEISIVSIPLNGDSVFISNSQTDFNLIFWDTTQTQPPNTVLSRKPIYVSYTGAFTLEQVAEATVSAVEEGVMGVPRSADIELPFHVGLSHYINV